MPFRGFHLLAIHEVRNPRGLRANWAALGPVRNLQCVRGRELQEKWGREIGTLTRGTRFRAECEGSSATAPGRGRGRTSSSCDRGGVSYDRGSTNTNMINNIFRLLVFLEIVEYV